MASRSKHELYCMGIKVLSEYDTERVKDALYEELHVLGPACFLDGMTDGHVEGVCTLIHHTMLNLQRLN